MCIFKGSFTEVPYWQPMLGLFHTDNSLAQLLILVSAIKSD